MFELTPTAGGGWTEKVLYSFNDTRTGTIPRRPDLRCRRQSLRHDQLGGTYGGGTVFELTPTAGGGWTEKVLYSFCSQTNCTDGAVPRRPDLRCRRQSLRHDHRGRHLLRRYGGTVFELTPTAGGGWTEKVLHSFATARTGLVPTAGLIFDAAGNLYGTTAYGGAYGAGTVFELTPTAGGGWTETGAV